MNFSINEVGMTPEILKRKLGSELTVPVTIASSEFSSATVVKAGSPISASGTIANTSLAVGILLNDVYKENPNGALIKAYATINKSNAEANASITLSSAVISALPLVVFE